VGRGGQAGTFARRHRGWADMEPNSYRAQIRPLACTSGRIAQLTSRYRTSSQKDSRRIAPRTRRHLARLRGCEPNNSFHASDIIEVVIGQLRKARI